MVSDQSLDIARRGKAIYEERLKSIMEPAHVNEFLAIEPDSGAYFLGKTLGDVAAAARKAHPKKVSFVMRIGHSAVVEIGGVANDWACR